MAVIPPPDPSTMTRERVLQAVTERFATGQRAAVLDLLDQYGSEPHHRERERVHLAIVELSRGSLDELRRLMDYAKRDYRDVLYWTELARGDQDPLTDRFTEATLTPEATPARLVLLKEAVPAATCVAVLWNPGYRAHDAQLAALEATARDLQVTLLPVGARRPADFDGAVATMRDGQAEAVLVLTSTTFQYHWPGLAERAVAGRLPAVGELREFAEAGGLLSYGPPAAIRRARSVGQMADLVRQLKRESPSEEPVTPRDGMELVVNLRTARVLGLTIPPSVLARADDVMR